MYNELKKKEDAVLEPLINADCPPVMPELDLRTPQKFRCPIYLHWASLFNLLRRRFKPQSLVAADLVCTMSILKECRCFLPAKVLSAL